MITTFYNFLLEKQEPSLTLWHGSTKHFDKFSTEYIGSGDGKSLGGWGIYFSDTKEVSERYYLKTGMLKTFKIRSGNWFDLDETFEDGRRILNALYKLGVDESDLEQFEQDYVENEDYVITNEDVLSWLNITLGEKETSILLMKLGYIGNTFKDKWITDATNYVLFSADDVISS